MLSVTDGTFIGTWLVSAKTAQTPQLTCHCHITAVHDQIDLYTPQRQPLAQLAGADVFEFCGQDVLLTTSWQGEPVSLRKAGGQVVCPHGHIVALTLCPWEQEAPPPGYEAKDYAARCRKKQRAAQVRREKAARMAALEAAIRQENSKRDEL
jgi:hypothetical protein